MKKNSPLLTPRGVLILRFIVGLVFLLVGLRFLFPSTSPLSANPAFVSVFAPRPYMKYLWVLFSGIIVVTNAQKLWRMKQEAAASQKAAKKPPQNPAAKSAQKSPQNPTQKNAPKITGNRKKS